MSPPRSQTLSLGFYRSNSIVSSVIRAITGSMWSHVFLIVGSGSCIEADWKGVHRTSLSKYGGGLVKIVRVSVPEALEGIRCAEMKIGKRYGYLEAFMFALLVPLRFLGVRLKNPFTRGIICTELVCDCLFAASGDVEWAKMRNDVTPGDLYFLITRRVF